MAVVGVPGELPLGACIKARMEKSGVASLLYYRSFYCTIRFKWILAIYCSLCVDDRLSSRVCDRIRTVSENFVAPLSAHISVASALSCYFGSLWLVSPNRASSIRNLRFVMNKVLREIKPPNSTVSIITVGQSWSHQPKRALNLSYALSNGKPTSNYEFQANARAIFQIVDGAYTAFKGEETS